MIKRILISILALFVIAFILIWALGGGYQKITAAVNHYRDPFKYGSVIDWFFQIGSTTGETFKLPGTPSNYPTGPAMPIGAATTSGGPTTVYQPGSGDGQGY